MKDKRKIKFLKESKDESVNAVGAAINFITKTFEEERYLKKFFKKLQTV